MVFLKNHQTIFYAITRIQVIIYPRKQYQKKRKSGLTLRLNLFQANELVPFHFVKPHFNEC